MDLVASLTPGFVRRGDGLGRAQSSSLALDLPCTESPAGPWTLNSHSDRRSQDVCCFVSVSALESPAPFALAVGERWVISK
ncbi:hypothetical protein V6N12_075903 [Hibiscus sabdariffa]|uniref:Uncharacterized protein n=1 Tax=Hibiscus sabdariffa TaxID=183260 RepID=A0ABR2AZA6_9ROSI